MQQHLVVLGFEVSKFIPYLLVLTIGLFVGFLYVLRSIRRENFKSKTESFFYIIQGVGSSMLITWICYEIMDYFFNLPKSLCIAVSGGFGYLGSESVSALVLDTLKKGCKMDLTNLENALNNSDFKEHVYSSLEGVYQISKVLNQFDLLKNFSDHDLEIVGKIQAIKSALAGYETSEQELKAKINALVTSLAFSSDRL